MQVWKAEHEGVQQELVDEGDKAAVSLEGVILPWAAWGPPHTVVADRVRETRRQPFSMLAAPLACHRSCVWPGKARQGKAIPTCQRLFPPP